MTHRACFFRPRSDAVSPIPAENCEVGIIHHQLAPTPQFEVHSMRVIQPEACVAIFERQPYWGPEMKRQFADHPILVRECRILGDLAPAVHDFSKAAFVIVMDDAPAECLAWLADQFIADNPIPRIVVGSSDFLPLEWSVREAGGMFMDDQNPRSNVARMCLRLLKHFPRTHFAAGCR